MSDRTADRVEVYEDIHGEFRWRRIAPNNEVLSASTESYKSKSYAVEQATELNPDVAIEVWE